MQLLRETAIPGDDETDATEENANVRDAYSTVIVRASQLTELVKMLLCPTCQCATLAVRAVNCSLGLVCKLETYCATCEDTVSSTLSSDRIGGTAGNLPFVVTRSVVSASMDMGVGHSGIVKLCRYLDMNTITNTTFATHRSAVTDASKETACNLLDNAAKVVRRVYVEADPSLANAELIDLTVSYDGSWMKRGHNSAYGIGCVIDTVTGLVLDLTVLSSYCQACSCAKARFGGSDTAKFHAWFRSHENDCNKNYTGAAGGMEVTAAEIMWGRSEFKGFRYTTMVSDGDARTFRHLSDLKVYGEDVALAKEECINHVAKRMGTALRKLSTQTKKNGVTLGGRGEGKLTHGAITKLSAYYGTAIRAHPNNVSDMQDAVLATFYHVSSTDAKPQHDLCPKGKESWCFFQRALAEGREPGDHRSNISTPLSPPVAAQVKEVYERLGHKDLLGRCLQGVTQNTNECLQDMGQVPQDRLCGPAASVVFDVLCCGRIQQRSPGNSRGTVWGHGTGDWPATRHFG